MDIVHASTALCERRMITVERKDKSSDILSDLPEEILKAAAKVGVTREDKSNDRAGTYFQLDENRIDAAINKRMEGLIEIMPIEEALKKYAWLKDYSWNLVPKDKDEFTKEVAKNGKGGYFMRILKDADVTFPLQSCLMVSDGERQRVHNIIIAEEGSNSRIITGCAKHPHAQNGEHLGISELYVKKGAKLHFTMIHDWAQGTKVRPRSVTNIEDGGEFISDYISLAPVADIQMYPKAVCKGKGSRAALNSILLAKGKSNLDIGSEIVLSGKGSQGEIVSRSIAKDEATLIVRGRLVGKSKECTGHLECQSLNLGEANIHAIPELKVVTEGAELSHEAAVGKISDVELVYLMSRGLSEDEATATIARGFLDAKILGLPEELEARIKKLVDEAAIGN